MDIEKESRINWTEVCKIFPALKMEPRFSSEKDHGFSNII